VTFFRENLGQMETNFTTANDYNSQPLLSPKF